MKEKRNLTGLCPFTPAFTRAFELGLNIPSSAEFLAPQPFSDDAPPFIPPGETLREALMAGSVNGSVHGYRSLESDGEDGFSVDPSADMRMDAVDRAVAGMKARVTAQAAALPGDLVEDTSSLDENSELDTVKGPALNASDSSDATVAK